MDFTGNTWAVLGLTLVIGWLLGLLSRSGGRKWKDAYNRERALHEALRKDHESLLKQQLAQTAHSPSAVDPVRTGAF